MVLNDLIDLFSYSQKNAGLKGLTVFGVLTSRELWHCGRQAEAFSGPPADPASDKALL